MARICWAASLFIPCWLFGQAPTAFTVASIKSNQTSDWRDTEDAHYVCLRSGRLSDLGRAELDGRRAMGHRSQDRGCRGTSSARSVQRAAAAIDRGPVSAEITPPNQENAGLCAGGHKERIQAQAAPCRIA